MEIRSSLGVKRHPDPPPLFGGALGVTVLALSLVAVALPLFGSTYLDQFRHGVSATLAPPDGDAANAPTVAPAAAPTPVARPDGPAPGSVSAASPPAPTPQLALSAAPADAAAVPAASTGTSPGAGSAASAPAANPAPAGPDAAATPRHGVTAGMDSVVDIAFAPGSAKLPNDHRGELTEIASLYRKHGGMVRVVGYGEAATGRDATEQTTFGLALDRARAVAVALSQLGVSPGDLRVEAAPLQSIPSGNSLGAGAEIFMIRS